jgi:hypothetical protein
MTPSTTIAEILKSAADQGKRVRAIKRGKAK